LAREATWSTKKVRQTETRKGKREGTCGESGAGLGPAMRARWGRPQRGKGVRAGGRRAGALCINNAAIGGGNWHKVKKKCFNRTGGELKTTNTAITA